MARPFLLLEQLYRLVVIGNHHVRVVPIERSVVLVGELFAELLMFDVERLRRRDAISDPRSPTAGH